MPFDRKMHYNQANAHMHTMNIGRNMKESRQKVEKVTVRVDQLQ